MKMFLGIGEGQNGSKFNENEYKIYRLNLP